MRLAASSNSRLRLAWVARIEPLPGSARPNASARQFIELAVNIPEQEPQVGQASRSIFEICSSETELSAAITIASTKSYILPSIFPASIGPPETKITGIFRRMAAIIIPGVILSQLDIQTIASARCALHMYSTLSAITSRDGSEYNIPSCPMAIPSSTAMVLNSAAKQPFCSIIPLMY